MAVIIRGNGKIVCAAINSPNEGDCYLDDGLHYFLSVEKKVLVTTDIDYHMKNGGEWWWKNQVPIGIPIDEFYYT